MRNLIDFKELRANALKKNAPHYREWCEIRVELTIHQDSDHAAGNALVARDAFMAGDFAAVESILGAPVGLSICGTAGEVMTEAAAKRAALQTWIDFFEDSPGEIIAMGRKFGRQFRTARGAAKFVIECDGVLHGLDVHCTSDRHVYVTNCAGQIREELADWFPDYADLFPHHLSTSKAGAPDQEAAIERWTADRKAPAYPGNYYEAACAHLESLGILESQSDAEIFVTGRGRRIARGYKYGSGWVGTPLPVPVLERVRELWTAAEGRRARRAA